MTEYGYLLRWTRLTAYSIAIKEKDPKSLHGKLRINRIHAIYVMVTGHSSKPGYFLSFFSPCHVSYFRSFSPISLSLRPSFVFQWLFSFLSFIFSFFLLRLYNSFSLFTCTIYDYAFISASLFTNFRLSLFYVYPQPVPKGCELISSVILYPHSSNRIHWSFTWRHTAFPAESTSLLFIYLFANDNFPSNRFIYCSKVSSPFNKTENSLSMKV